MTANRFSMVISGCLLSLFFWGYHVTETAHGITNTTYGDFTKQFGCENATHKCMEHCRYCYHNFHGPTMECLSFLFDKLCLRDFEGTMTSLNTTDWCIWGNVRSVYSNFSHCTEEISDCLLIPWPNPLVEQTFVGIHSMFFKDCPTEELSDPPPLIIFALVITPICLIPIMVNLVVLKTKNGDGSS